MIYCYGHLFLFLSSQLADKYVSGAFLQTTDLLDLYVS